MGIAGVRRKQDRLQLPRVTPRAELPSGAAAKMGPTMARSRAKIANTMAEAATPRSKSPASPSTAVPTSPRAPPCWFHEQRWPSHAAWLPWFATQLPPALPPPCQATVVTEGCVVTPALPADLATALGNAGQLPPALRAQFTSWHRSMTSRMRSLRDTGCTNALSSLASSGETCSSRRASPRRRASIS
jgi:hypothetical protein